MLSSKQVLGTMYISNILHLIYLGIQINYLSDRLVSLLILIHDYVSVNKIHLHKKLNFT